jgi:PAS domain S-box-containing protein
MAMVDPEDREHVAQAADAMLKGAGTSRVDYRITRSNGEARDIHMEAETIMDVQGTPVSMSGTVQDVTELRRTEAALSDSEASLRHAQRIARIGNWDRDLALDELYWSDEMYHLFGFDRDTAPAPSIDMFMERVHPDDRKRMRRAMEEALAGTGPYDLDVRIQLPGGAQRILHAQGELSRDATGEPRRFSGIAQDVTELRQAEAEVRRLNAELEQRVERRTAELREAQAELIKKDRLATLGQLTATVSHELRNPLGAMRTSAYVLAKSLPDGNEAALKAVARIERGVTRCDRIIDELLDFTRSTEIDREPVTIDDWLEAVLSELSIPDGVKLETDLRLGTLASMFDSRRMRRAIINIVENACQAIAGQAGWDAGTSKGIVTVSTGKVNGDIEIRIADDGPGIPADIREKIFEPLYSTKNFGVGLGLPTVRQILEQHGGSVALESESGVGTLFRLVFPFEEPEEGQQSTVGNCFPAAMGRV